MANKFKVKRGTNLSNITTAPEAGELIYKSDTKQLFVGDGSTAASALTPIGGASTSGSNNQLLTDDGSGGINSEGSLTFNGTTLAITGSLTASGNATISGTASVTSSITTGYGVAFTNGNTNFLVYNNTNDDLLYLRDTTNGQMLQTWRVSSVDIHRGMTINQDGGAYDTRIEGDTDTHLFFVDASADRVGISTSSPGATLDIGDRIYLKDDGTIHWGSAAAHGILSWDTGRAIVTATGANNLDLKAASGYSVVVNESGSNVDFRVEGDSDTNLLFTDAGNDKVGIGTQSPGTKLHVQNGATSYTWTPYAGTTAMFEGTSSNHSIVSIVGSTTGQSSIWFGDTDHQSIGRVRYEHANNQMEFWTSGLERVAIDSSGRLLIGDTSVHYTGTDLQVGNTSDSQNGIQIQTSTTGYGYVLFGDGTGADAYRGQISYKHGDDYMSFLTSGSERMRIDATGTKFSENFSATDDILHINPANGHNRTMELAGDAINVTVTGGSSTTLKLQEDGGNVSIGEHLELPYGEINDAGTDLNIVGTNAVTLQSSAGTALTIPNASTNVGIGIASPSASLHINTTNDASVYFTRDGGSAFSIEHDTSQLYFYNRTIGEAVFLMSHSGPVVINQGGDDAVDFRVESDGDQNMLFVDASTNRVGIGTGSPDSELHVVNNVANLKIESSGLGNASYLHIKNTDNQYDLFNNGGDFQIDENGVATRFVIKDSTGHIGFNETSPSTELHLGTCPDGRAITFDQSGRFNGIGNYFSSNASDSQLWFHLSTGGTDGGENVRMKVYADGRLQLVNSDNNGMLLAKATRMGYSSSYKALIIGETSGTYTTAFGYDPSTNASASFTGDGREIIFRNGVEFTTPNSANNGFHNDILVLKDGKVGILTSSPGQALDVNGHLQVRNGYQYYGDSTSGVLSTGSWAGDLTSNGWERVAGLSHDGGEFVLVEKNGQVSTLVDGSYFAYEAGSNTGGGFWSSSNSTYGAATGIIASGGTLYVKQADGGNASLFVTGDIILNSGYISGQGNDLQLRRTTNDDDKIVIEASETKIYGDAAERVRFGSYGIRNKVNGSAASPSFSFVDDTNTGIYRAGSDDMRFVAGGDARFAANGNGLDLSVNSASKIAHNTTATRDKYRVWNSSLYTIGMDDNMTFGGLGSYAMTFQMNNENNRGFWWGDSNHTDAQGAMGLTTEGLLTVAHSIRVGYGHTDTTSPGATYRLDVSGSIGATADVVAYISSDKRLKDNIKNIANPLEKLEKLNGVEFDWNDKQDLYKGHDIGVIAQEVEEVLPEIVDTREDGHKAVKYDRMVALLIEAVKEQQQQINELKEKLNG